MSRWIAMRRRRPSTLLDVQRTFLASADGGAEQLALHQGGWGRPARRRTD